MAEECFMCLDERNCNLIDAKMLALIEFLLPEITIIKMGIPLNVCYICDEKLQLFSEFKLACLENSQCLEASVRRKTINDRTTQTCPQDTLDFDKEPDTSILEYYESQINKYLEVKQSKSTEKQTTPESDVENYTSDTNSGWETKLHTKDDTLENIETDKNTSGNVVEPEQQEDAILEMETSEDTSQYQPEVRNEISPDVDSKAPENNFHESDESDSQMTSDATFCKVHHIITDHDYLDLETFCTKLFTKSVKAEVRHGEVIQIEEYNCAVCDKNFHDKNVLLPHMNEHRGITNYQCQFCFRQYRSYVHFTKHLKRHVISQRAYKCPSCYLAFLSQNRLNRHIIKVHTERQECTICFKKFVFAKQLRKHLLSHQRKTKHRCTICHYYFYSYEVLIQHSLKAHNKDLDCLMK